MLEILIHAHLAVAGLLRGRLPEAGRAFALSLARCQATGECFVAARACALLGQVQRAEGRLGAALGTCQQALEHRPPALTVGITPSHRVRSAR